MYAYLAQICSNDKTPFWNRFWIRSNLFHICSKEQKKYLRTNLFPTARVCSNGTYFILNNISPKPYNIKNTSLFHTLNLGLTWSGIKFLEYCSTRHRSPSRRTKNHEPRALPTQSRLCFAHIFNLRSKCENLCFSATNIPLQALRCVEDE